MCRGTLWYCAIICAATLQYIIITKSTVECAVICITNNVASIDKSAACFIRCYSVIYTAYYSMCVSHNTCSLPTLAVLLSCIRRPIQFHNDRGASKYWKCMKHLNATYEIYSKFCTKFTFTYVLVSDVGLFIVIRRGAVNEGLKTTKVECELGPSLLFVWGHDWNM